MLEAFLKLVDQLRAAWQHRGQFYGVASQMMRRILVERSEGVSENSFGLET